MRKLRKRAGRGGIAMRMMRLNLEDRSAANAREGQDASSEASTSNAANHPPINLGNCARTNPQSSVENAEAPFSKAQIWSDRPSTLRERLRYLFNNEVLSDVKFLVGRGSQQQRIPAHKLILSAGSAVFDAMFNGTLATTSLEIEVPDVEPTAFLAVLLFLYTDQFRGDPETVMTILYTAKKYAVSQLEKYCVEFLQRNLYSDNAFMLLAQARLFDEPRLAAVCLNEIDESTAVALNADGFTDIDIDTLMLVLERETLRIDEIKLFQAVVRWSEAECARQQLPVTPENQKKVLGKALYLVRFPLMSLEAFAAGPAQSGILTDKEIVSLFLYFTVNPKPSVDFKVKPRGRMALLGKELRACRFQHTERMWGLSGGDDQISFTVDKRIFLIGYGVYGSVNRAAGYAVAIDLIHTSSGKVIASNDTNFSSDGSMYPYRVTFKEPVEIIPNTEYTASANLRGPVSHYGVNGLRRVTVDCKSTKEKVTFQFSCASDGNNGTSPETGQIPEIIFCM